MTDRTPARRPSRTTSTPQRILSTGLAAATCIGVVGLLGARTVEANAAAAEADPVDVAAPAAEIATSSSGLTEEQLDTYAAELARQRDGLEAYRADLITAAQALGLIASPARTTSTSRAASPARAATIATPTARKPKPRPRPQSAPALKAAPAPARPQATTKGS